MSVCPADLDALVPCFFFFHDTATPEIYTLSLHDALPIWTRRPGRDQAAHRAGGDPRAGGDRRRHGQLGGGQHLRRRRRSEEHTSELQSRGHLVCRLLLEKKKCNNSSRYALEFVLITVLPD